MLPDRKEEVAGLCFPLSKLIVSMFSILQGFTSIASVSTWVTGDYLCKSFDWFSSSRRNTQIEDAEISAKMKVQKIIYEISKSNSYFMSTKPAKNIQTSKKSLKKNRDFPKDYLV